MDELILITELNDFIFCPISIYFHKLYSGVDNMLFQSSYQINGKNAHKAVDEGNYSTRSNIVTSMNLYSEKYGLVGKLDMFDIDKGILRERKRTIKEIYDGYIFQIYAQYFCLIEMGYSVQKLELYSVTDNKIYPIKKPEDNLEMKKKFESVIKAMKNFDMEKFNQDNKMKCTRCIYEPACDRGSL